MGLSHTDGCLDKRWMIEILIIVLNFTFYNLGPAMMTTKTPATESHRCSETRCECGQLIAKVVDSGLELKCKRCKRIVVIPFSAIEGASRLTS